MVPICLAILNDPVCDPAIHHRKTVGAHKGWKGSSHRNGATRHRELKLEILECVQLSCVDEIFARGPNYSCAVITLPQFPNHLCGEIFASPTSAREFPEDRLIPCFDEPRSKFTKPQLEAHGLLAIARL